MGLSRHGSFKGSSKGSIMEDQWDLVSLLPERAPGGDHGGLLSLLP